LGQEELLVVVVILPSKGLTLLMPVVLLQGSAVTPLCRLRVQERSRLRVQERKPSRVQERMAEQYNKTKTRHGLADQYNKTETTDQLVRSR